MQTIKLYVSPKNAAGGQCSSYNLVSKALFPGFGLGGGVTPPKPVKSALGTRLCILLPRSRVFHARIQVFVAFARFEKRCCLKPAGYLINFLLSIALFENTFTLPRRPILVSFITWTVRTTFYVIVRSTVENAGKQFSLEFLPGLGLYIYPVQYICH